MSPDLRQLFDRLPTFDPAWPDEMRKQWLAWADQLMAPDPPKLTRWQRFKAWFCSTPNIGKSRHGG